MTDKTGTWVAAPRGDVRGRPGAPGSARRNQGGARAHRAAGDGAGRRVWIAMIALAVAAALLGGSSRYDAGQVILLQPVSWLALGALLWGTTRADLTTVKWPALLLVSFTVITALQLVTLPATWWTALPGRQIVADMDGALGTVPGRPMSLVPTRTMHALASLGVPLAGLLAFLALGPRRIYTVSIIILAIAAANVILGVLQVIAPDTAWLNLYSDNGPRVASGLFANPNHAGVFGAVILVFIAALLFAGGAAGPQNDAVSPQQRILLFFLYALTLMAALMSGSRAALLACVIALGTTSLLALRRSQRDSRQISQKSRRAAGSTSNKARSRRPIISYLSGLAALAIFFSLVLADRLPAFEQLMAEDPMSDIRFDYLPTLWGMAGIYFPFGAGMGSLEDVFYIHEPTGLLQPAYLNMAHNDWLQLIIEAGLPGAAVLMGTLAWIAYLVIRLVRSGKGNMALALVCGFGIVAFASYFDYPLRTPLMQLLCVWFLLIVHGVVSGHLPNDARLRAGAQGSGAGVEGRGRQG